MQGGYLRLNVLAFPKLNTRLSAQKLHQHTIHDLFFKVSRSVRLAKGDLSPPRSTSM